uniref:Uncharacterized protein n=1 Tax=Lepisosteus oculatus TaxID=7918 RepID=W5M1Z7_LEPOC
MLFFQFLQACCLAMLILSPSGSSNPVRCEENTQNQSSVLCSGILDQFDFQIIDMPDRLYERSVAPWNYVVKMDVNRIPQVIHEAHCTSSHNCEKVKDSASSLESIPLSITIPVLKKKDKCASYSVEQETIRIACICATARQQ